MSGKGGSGEVRTPSRALLGFFDVYLHRYLPRHFHALRLAHAERWRAAKQPLIVCLNHPSWWDPLVCIRLSRVLAPRLEHYAPIDAHAMKRYGILRKLGLFGVEQGTTRGAAQFLRCAEQILRRPNAVLWLTPQGSLTDPRRRPVRFRAGLDALLRRVGPVTVLPLALEYPFWTERLPEALALFGEAMEMGERSAEDAPGVQVEKALAAAQEELGQRAMQQDAAAFDSVFARAQGTGGVYGAWQSMRSALRGEGFHPEHAALVQASRTEGQSREGRR